jgi:5S rRNA maturation endonuclease (ribonuclease M5)
MKEYQTSDLSLGAYLLMKGLKLKKAEKIQSGKFIFLFSDPDDRGNVLAIEFLNSELCEYDNHVRNLKKILYSK